MVGILIFPLSSFFFGVNQIFLLQENFEREEKKARVRGENMGAKKGGELRMP